MRVESPPAAVCELPVACHGDRGRPHRARLRERPDQSLSPTGVYTARHAERGDGGDHGCSAGV